jgi:hypothetical protein
MAFMAFLIASSSHDCLVDFLLYVPTILDYTVKQFFVENYEEVIEGKMTYQRNHMSFYPHTSFYNCLHDAINIVSTDTVENVFAAVNHIFYVNFVFIQATNFSLITVTRL